MGLCGWSRCRSCSSFGTWWSEASPRRTEQLLTYSKYINLYSSHGTCVAFRAHAVWFAEGGRAASNLVPREALRTHIGLRGARLDTVGEAGDVGGGGGRILRAGHGLVATGLVPDAS